MTFALAAWMLAGPALAQSPTPNLLTGQARPHVLPLRLPGKQLASPLAPVGAQLSYYGGRVVSNAQVVVVLWGSGNFLPQIAGNASPGITDFYSGVLNSSYLDWLSGEYDTQGLSVVGTPGTNQVIGRGSLVGSYRIVPATTGATGTTVDDTAIQAELAAQIAAGHLPAPEVDAAGNNNSYYAVFFPAGISITMSGSPGSCVSGGFCAYHGTSQTALGEIYYGVQPDFQPPSLCATGCGGSTAFNNVTSVASHELTETLTDAEVGFATAGAPPLGWYDLTLNQEIGDLCNQLQGTVTGGDGKSYTVQQEFSNLAAGCILGRGVDFSLQVSPGSTSVPVGGSSSFKVTVSTSNATNEPVTLSLSGLPAGVSASFAPATVSTGQSSTLTLLAASGLGPSASRAITVTGKAASGSHTATARLSLATAGAANAGSGGDIPTLPDWGGWLLGLALLGFASRATGAGRPG